MRHKIFIVLALLSLLGWGETLAQETVFSKETFTYGNITLPYRKANIPGDGDKASLVVYLHGGSSKGNDNETQIQEPGVSAISTWLRENGRNAVMLVPQCPANLSWLGAMQDAIVSLLRTYIERGVADASKVYILGGSMGGTGTWNMLSNHPELFAAAMPVAGNPSGLDAEAVAKTPLFTVMGTADRIMKISNVEAFLKDMDADNAEYRFEIEDGWTHEDVCKNSYTGERLDWLFKHTRASATGIVNIGGKGGKAVKILWFTVSGQRLEDAPKQRRIYIKTSIYADGSIASKKCQVN